MIVTIHQPNYLPYLGFFHKMANADVLVLYDTAQYSKQLGFHNRNRIKTPQGAQWLTVPVQHATLRAIRDVQIVDGPWALRHRQALDANYRRAPCYASYEKEIHAVLEKPWTSLADLNEALIALVARWLSIRTKIVHASELPAPQTDDATAKNIHMVRSLGGDTYLSGQGGHDYLDESQFTDVRLVYDAFTPTPYPQLFGEFMPNLAAIDAVFNCGESIKLRKMFGDASR
ncbi:MAG: WbqC family protein [Methanobacteriota archaeon]|nr:MAG: WbqC family protein [Euryarchaeota archaeon]